MTSDVESLSCRRPVATDAPQLAEVATQAWRVGFHGLVPQSFLDELDPARSRIRWESDLASERTVPPHFGMARKKRTVSKVVQAA
jgi:hypothetical protein